VSESPREAPQPLRVTTQNKTLLNPLFLHSKLCIYPATSSPNFPRTAATSPNPRPLPSSTCRSRSRTSTAFLARIPSTMRRSSPFPARTPGRTFRRRSDASGACRALSSSRKMASTAETNASSPSAPTRSENSSTTSAGPSSSPASFT